MATSQPLPRRDLKAPVLNSWKEIATYLGRGVRTVQRYEREFKLPVRRVGTKSRKSVVALSQDLDAWLRHATVQKYEPPVSQGSENAGVITESVASSHELRDRCAQLREENAKAVMKLSQTLSELMRQIEIGLLIRGGAFFRGRSEREYASREASNPTFRNERLS